MDLQKNFNLNFFKPNTVRKLSKADTRNNVMKKDINLLPREIMMQRSFDEAFKKACFISARVLLLACALLTVPLIFRFTLTFDKNLLVKKINDISKIEEIERQVQAANAQLGAYRELITALNKNDSVIATVFTAMEKVIPNTMYLTSVSQQNVEVKSEGKKTTEKQRMVFIEGIAKDKDAVADFQRSLKDSSLYKNVFVTEIKDVDIIEENKVKTTVTNEFGETVEKEITVSVDAQINVSYKMECILNDWK